MRKLKAPHSAIAAALVLSLSALGHGVHASLTVAESGAGGKTIEITVVASADDLQNVLRKQTGRDLEIDRDKDAERLVFGYLTRNIEFQGTSGKDGAMPLKWIGMEVTVSKLTAYMEIAAPLPLAGLRIRNTLLFDALADQVNMMTVRRDKKSKASNLLFPPGSREWQTVNLPADLR